MLLLASVLDWGGFVKAGSLLKTNIDALLRARHQTRHDLAMWCRRSDAWLSKILGKDNRNVPLEYLDRIGDFFGLAAYQLFQPGISPMLERRKGLDRRSGKDRRLSAVNHQVRESVSSLIANIKPADVADLIRLRALSEGSRATLRDEAQRLERSERENDARGTRRRSAERVAGGARASTARPLERRAKKPPPPPDA